MKKNLKPVTIILVVSILIGLLSGTVQKINIEAHKEVPQITYEDTIQMLNKDVENKVEFTEKTTLINDCDFNITNEMISKNSQKEIIAMFLVDTSGSMSTRFENKLEKVQNSLLNFLSSVGTNMYIGLISYSSDVTLNVPLKKFDEYQAEAMICEVEGLRTAGKTHLYEAVALGLKLVAGEMEEHPNAFCNFRRTPV